MAINVLSDTDVRRLQAVLRWFEQNDESVSQTPLGRFELSGGLRPYRQTPRPPQVSRLVQITAIISGAKGYYQGRLQTAGATLTASANLAASQLGTFATTDDSNKVVVCNLQELDNATSGHALDPAGDPDIFACFEIPGMISSNAWSTRVVFIHGDQYDTDC